MLYFILFSFLFIVIGLTPPPPPPRLVQSLTCSELIRISFATIQLMSDDYTALIGTACNYLLRRHY
jgi:hypothetical protein